MSSKPTESFHIPVCLQEDTIPLSAFIDSSAAGNFIHPHVVISHKLPTTPCLKKLKLQLVTRWTFHIVTHQVHTQMTTQHGHKEDIVFDIAPIGKHEILLRLPWCRLHQVQFNWQQGGIAQWGLDCKNHFPKTLHKVTLGHATLLEYESTVTYRLGSLVVKRPSSDRVVPGSNPGPVIFNTPKRTFPPSLKDMQNSGKLYQRSTTITLTSLTPSTPCPNARNTDQDMTSR